MSLITAQLEIIAKAREEIIKIQDACKHPVEHVGSLSYLQVLYDPDSEIIRNTCTICEKQWVITKNKEKPDDQLER